MASIAPLEAVCVQCRTKYRYVIENICSTASRVEAGCEVLAKEFEEDGAYSETIGRIRELVRKRAPTISGSL